GEQRQTLRGIGEAPESVSVRLHGYLDVNCSRSRSYDLQRIKKTVGAINRFDGTMWDRTLRLSAYACQSTTAQCSCAERPELQWHASCLSQPRPEFRSVAIHPPGLTHTARGSRFVQPLANAVEN